MTTFRGRLRTSSEPLGVLFERFLFGLYKKWYALPARSTRRHVDQLRANLAAILRDPAHDDAQIRTEIAAFTQELVSLSGVRLAAPDLLEKVQQRLDQSASETFSAEEKQKILDLLDAPDPAAAAIGRMVYHPQKLSETLWAIYAKIGYGTDALHPDLQQQVDAIYYEFQRAQDDAQGNRVAEQTAYGTALDQMAAIPEVLETAYAEFLAGKVDDLTQIMTSRSGSPSWSSPGGNIPKGFGPFSAGEAAEAAPGDEALASTSEPTDVQFHTDVRFPPQVKLRDEVPLIVQLTLQKHAESIVADGIVLMPFADPTKPEYVEVVVMTAGFSSRPNSWSRTITVYSNQDSQPAIFLLRAETEGDHQITIDFRHNEKQIGHVKFQTTVSNRPTRMGTTPTVDQAIRMAQPRTSTSAADLELRITQDADKNRLLFMLHSSKASVGYHWRPVGAVQLTGKDPQEYLEQKFQRMSKLAGQLTANSTQEEVENAMREIETFGEGLFEDLFPPELQDEYWDVIKPLREEGKISTLMITSDEPWIPWEMVKPYKHDPRRRIEERDTFLSESFQLSRWLAGFGPADSLIVRSVEMVIPELNLAFVDEEKSYLEGLADGDRVKVSTPLQLRNDVIKRAREGGFELFHFAAHGLFDPQHPDRSPLTMQDGELVPEDLRGSQLRGLRESRPLVFLNACNSGRMNFALRNLGGWAQTMVDEAGVSAFVGTLWEVNDALALEFARFFYDGLRAGQSLGQAFHEARRQTKEKGAANPTWLAYTLYGDPNGVVMWGAESDQ